MSKFKNLDYGATAASSFNTTPRGSDDPYQYQVGFGNRFASEAIPGVLPDDRNMPQKNKYDLYTEGMTGSSFVAPRADNLNAWLYRIRPSVAHQGFSKLPENPDLESNFLPLNLKVHVSPTQLAWHPFDFPSEDQAVDFVDGMKTVAGNGDPTLHEGIAVHMYLANTSMGRKAFCNADGDMLILPERGKLNIQTEFGRMMVRPGELAVIQRGMKFKVQLPDGPSRGYIQEIFGSHYTLPELGPLGGHGLANPRDFESPLASFDLDQNHWDIIYKVCGELHSCSQEHTPFDVVAWHGNYVPYKYDMSKFTFVGSISKDHIDPSIFCVLTAKSKAAGVPLADFLIFSGRWDVGDGTFRPPYYHRNSSTEFMGMIYGEYGGRSDGFKPGGASFETGFCPHGVSYEEFKKATEGELRPTRVHENTLVFMFESSMMWTITDWAMKRSGKLHEHEPKMWDNLKGQFMNYLEEVEEDLRKAGLPGLGRNQRVDDGQDVLEQVSMNGNGHLNGH
ncbi:homogentisate 1,2-dioxygenase [Lentinula aciculospora]|uniref:homogentisate 1,2-dioxygenase n=1 Tax=Lentinula aciculospora TaxID=153920 RepID=A0A9W9DPI0_9AGAR|nr:homogentisate 1,2-dioxygenase [Lentinula aciculospora]